MRQVLALLALFSALWAGEAFAQVSTPTCPGTPNALGQASPPITALPYTMTFNDVCLLKVFSSASPGVVKIPAPGTGGNFGKNFPVSFWNEGAGTLTLTPQISSSGFLPTINGQSTLPLVQGQGADLSIGSDGNWYANAPGTAGATSAPSFNATTSAGYQQYGARAFTVANGNFTFVGAPSCNGNCDTLVGALAGGNVDPINDHLTTAVGFNSGGAMNSSNTESTLYGWNTAGNITGAGPYFLNILGVNTLGLCTIGCTTDTVIGDDAALHTTTLTNSIIEGHMALNQGNGNRLVAIGTNAMFWNLTATGLLDSVAIGNTALSCPGATTATNNIGIGTSVMVDCTSAEGNVGIGLNDFGGNGTTFSGAENNAVGTNIAVNATTITHSNMIGAFAGNLLTTGSAFNLICWKCGLNLAAGSSNDTIIGGAGTGGTAVTSQGLLLLASGNKSVDVASSSTSNYLSIDNIITATGTNVPATSVTTIAGTLAVTGTSLTVGGGTVAPVLSGTTGSIGGGALLAGACTSGTVAVTNSTTAMAVQATPATYPGDGNYWMGYVSTAGTVTVKVCAAVAGTPSASTYNVRVIQ